MKTRNQVAAPARRGPAFTLIELLVVVAIIAILAAFTLPVLHSVKRQQYIKSASAELGQIEAALENYKAKYGAYPPGNPNNPALNQLYYELIGTTNTITTPPAPAGSQAFQTLDNSSTLNVSQLNAVFGPAVSGFVNCTKPGGGEDAAPARNFLPGLKATQIGTYNSGAAPVLLLVTAVRGPDDTYQPLGQPDLNPFRYNSFNPTNNTGSYDLWIDLSISGKTNRISNWSRTVQINP